MSRNSTTGRQAQHKANSFTAKINNILNKKVDSYSGTHKDVNDTEPEIKKDRSDCVYNFTEEGWRLGWRRKDINKRTNTTIDKRTSTKKTGMAKEGDQQEDECSDRQALLDEEDERRRQASKALKAPEDLIRRSSLIYSTRLERTCMCVDNQTDVCTDGQADRRIGGRSGGKAGCPEERQTVRRKARRSGGKAGGPEERQAVRRKGRWSGGKASGR